MNEREEMVKTMQEGNAVTAGRRRRHHEARRFCRLRRPRHRPSTTQQQAIITLVDFSLIASKVKHYYYELLRK